MTFFKIYLFHWSKVYNCFATGTIPVMLLTFQLQSIHTVFLSPCYGDYQYNHFSNDKQHLYKDL